MIRTAKTKLTQGGLRHAITIGLRLTITVVFLCAIAPATASAQTMGSSAIYSDGWVDSYNDQGVFGTPVIRMIGCGVTRDYNNTYGHSYWVVTNLRSPSGRTSSATSYRTNSYSAYTRAETSLPWDWNAPDPGNFQVQTQHWMCCPYMGGYGGTCFPSSNSSFVFPIGVRVDAYQLLSETFVGGRFGHGVADFDPTCNGTCTVYPQLGTSKLLPGFAPNYLQCYTLYFFGCVQITKVCVGREIPGVCD